MHVLDLRLIILRIRIIIVITTMIWIIIRLIIITIRMIKILVLEIVIMMMIVLRKVICWFQVGALRFLCRFCFLFWLGRTPRCCRDALVIDRSTEHMIFTLSLQALWVYWSVNELELSKNLEQCAKVIRMSQCIVGSWIMRRPWGRSFGLASWPKMSDFGSWRRRIFHY